MGVSPVIKVLVTGGTGQVGWEVCRRAPAAGVEVVAPSRTALDITRRTQVRAALDRTIPGLVINCAAYTDVDRAEEETAAAYAVNQDGVANLAEACSRIGTALIHLSTDYVFDGTKNAPYTEDDQVAPASVYGASKAAGEAALRERLPGHVILRTAWVCGARGRNFVKSVLARVRAGEPLRVVDDQRGAPTFAADIADAVWAVIAGTLSADVPVWGTYHYCGLGEATWHDVARETVRLVAPTLGRSPEVMAISSAEYGAAALRPPYSVLDCRLIERTFQVSRRPWREGLARLIDALGAEQAA
jgi:dTDP-4-dehydrorhamnose reductase